MLHPTYPRILPDRDQVNDWYLDQDITITLHNGHTLTVTKGFKFDSHSVPFVFRLAFPRHIPTEDNKGNDIFCALVHDALVAAEHWLPYPRSFVDYEYWRFMQMPEYKMTDKRAYWMPLAVKSSGAVRYYWRDDRGTVPAMMHTTICVKVNVV